jgi:hypothetical protein
MKDTQLSSRALACHTVDPWFNMYQYTHTHIHTRIKRKEKGTKEGRKGGREGK